MNASRRAAPRAGADGDTSTHSNGTSVHPQRQASTSPVESFVPLPRVPDFGETPGSSSDSGIVRGMEAMRLLNQSQVSTTTEQQMALLINLNEILGDFGSVQSTPSRLSSRITTPAPESTMDIEVTASDLERCDIQGVDWSSYAVSRDDYRDIRMKEYREFEAAHQNAFDILPDEDDSSRTKTVSPMGPMLSFGYTNKADSCHVPHFQLRHLLCAPTVRSVIFPHFSRIKCWNPVLNQSEVLFNTMEYGPQYSKTSVIAATKSHLFVGGFSGEIITISLDSPRVARGSGEGAVRLRTYSTDPNCITNHIETLEAEGRLFISCNDATLRLADIETGTIKPIARFSYPLNASAADPSRSLIATAGDSKKVRLLDYNSTQEAAVLTGHTDHLFALSWSPCGRFLATGSQDRSARVFDARMLKHSLHTLVANMAAVRSVKFSPCGGMLAVMEADDYVNVYSVQSDFHECQVIDFFGEASGIAFDPDGNSFYIGCAGAENGGIFEFHRTTVNN